MNTRRSFFKQLGILVPVFSVLPSALTYERIWKPKQTDVRPVSCREFADFLNSQAPEYERAIIGGWESDIFPNGNWTTKSPPIRFGDVKLSDYSGE